MLRTALFEKYEREFSFAALVMQFCKAAALIKFFSVKNVLLKVLKLLTSRIAFFLKMLWKKRSACLLSVQQNISNTTSDLLLCYLSEANLLKMLLTMFLTA